MYEVFNPRDGITVFKTRFRWLAKLVAHMLDLDWNIEGEGWL